MPKKNVEKREKKMYQLEFEFRSSIRILFNYLSTPSGLSDWFADDVTVHENIYTFIWGKTFEEAELLSRKEPTTVRFKWVENEPDTYFEFDIVTDDLTSDVALIITDFAYEDEMNEQKLLWESQIQNLKQTIGS
ncbi:MAG: START-like domain-containing protein [Bacteroidia bacterium]